MSIDIFNPGPVRLAIRWILMATPFECVLILQTWINPVLIRFQPLHEFDCIQWSALDEFFYIHLAFDVIFGKCILQYFLIHDLLVLVQCHPLHFTNLDCFRVYNINHLTCNMPRGSLFYTF